VVSTGDGEIYLKFALDDIDGQATSAKLFIHSSTVASADGTGGDVYVVGNEWSEAMLTWSTRPTVMGTTLGRIGTSGVAPGMWYSVDVSAAVDAPGTYSFAIVPGVNDTNGAHFLAKEASPANAAYLEITVEPIAGTSDGEADSGTAGGTDDDGGTSDGDATTSADSGITGGGTVGFDEGSKGCGCATTPHRGAWLLVLGVFVRPRRRRPS
jgi:MYXO-CTERM domain-containing protein